MGNCGTLVARLTMRPLVIVLSIVRSLTAAPMKSFSANGSVTLEFSWWITARKKACWLRILVKSLP